MDSMTNSGTKAQELSQVLLDSDPDSPSIRPSKLLYRAVLVCVLGSFSFGYFTGIMYVKHFDVSVAQVRGR